jgi:hypothetical protein
MKRRTFRSQLPALTKVAKDTDNPIAVRERACHPNPLASMQTCRLDRCFVLEQHVKPAPATLVDRKRLDVMH